MMARGSKHYAAKLTEADIPLILDMMHSGVNMVTIAKRFNVSRNAIAQIKYWKAWCHTRLRVEARMENQHAR